MASGPTIDEAREKLDNVAPPYACTKAPDRGRQLDPGLAFGRKRLEPVGDGEVFGVPPTPPLARTALSPRHQSWIPRYIVPNLPNDHIKRFDGVVGYHVRLTFYERERSRVRASVES